MGGGCSRSSSQGPKVGESNLSMNVVSPNKSLEINVAALNGNTKYNTPQSLSRVIGFTVSRAANIGTDAGSRTSSTILRSNSYWLHEDDDRIDTVINNWKDDELLFLQRLFNDYLLSYKRSTFPQAKGRIVNASVAVESPRLPIELLMGVLTSRKLFVAVSGTLLGITFTHIKTSNGTARPSESAMLSSVADAGAPTSFLSQPPVILRIRLSQNDSVPAVASPYVCEAAGAAPLHASSFGSIYFSMSPALSPTSSGTGRASSFTQPQRCAPMYGLSARGLYQAMCVQTLAISISQLESKMQSTHQPRRTRTFHFHIRKAEGVADTESKREKGEEENNIGSSSSLSLDFKDFSCALAIIGGRASREEMLIFLFLLFAEPLLPPDIPLLDSDGSLKQEDALTHAPSAIYNDTIGMSSPRDIYLQAGSPCVGEKEDNIGEVLALSQTGLDCLVRFLIVSQAISASSTGTHSPTVPWANSILDIESQDYHDPVIIARRPLYTFAVRNEHGGSRVPLVVCHDIDLPMHLPTFLSLFSSPPRPTATVGTHKTSSVQVDLPSADEDILSLIFSTTNLITSLSVFIDDAGDISTSVPKEKEKSKRTEQQQTDFIVPDSNGEVKEEPISKMSLSVPVRERDDSRTNKMNSANNSPQSRLMKGSNTSVSPEVIRQASTNSPITARKVRKTNSRVISPSCVEPVMIPAYDGIDSLPSPIEDHDSNSIESSATCTTGDSSNQNVVAKRGLVGKHSSVGSFHSTILAALSFSSSTPSSRDPAPINRSRSNTASGSVFPSAAGTKDSHTFSSACGLINLGNTCFMSSALQCLVHSPLLREYFMTGRFKDHLNVENPLGTKGVLTQEFAALIDSMWATAMRAAKGAANGISSGTGNMYKKPLKQSSQASSPVNRNSGALPLPLSVAAPYIAPHDFKRVLQTCKSQFQGHEQQDVQEFLAELMDALHEDLNRFRRYSAPHIDSSEETLSKTVAGSASMFYKKFIGQSGKRVVTLHVTPNEPTTPPTATKDKDEIPKMATTPVAVPILQPVIDRSLHAPPPLTLQAQGKGAWEQHLVRNRSCIVDLFQGQLCSEVTCNECGNVSRTFDPFTSLSLPLPPQHDITVVVTFLRRMPRLSTVAMSKAQEPDSSIAAATARITSAQMAAADPIRLVIVLPRLSDVSDLRKAICQMLSPAAPKLNASALNLAAKGQNGAAPAGQVILPNNLTLLDCSPEGEGGLLRTILEDRESILHLIEAISRGNLASPSASAANLFQRTESGMDVYFRTGLPVESANPKAMAGRYRMDGINGSPTQAGGDPLRKAVLDNVNNGMVLHCVAVENAKNIPFIFSLSTSRLGARNAGATLHSQNATNCAADAAGNKNGSEDKGKEVGRDGKELDQRILSAQTDPYTDEAEYLERHLDRSEGDLVTDLDFELPIDVQKTEERKTRNVKKDNSIFARWPKSIEGLALGRRVDALDHRGQWFAGTVMDKWNVSSEELQELAEKTNSSSSSNNSSNNNITAGKGRGKSKEATTPTRHGSNTMINRDKDRNKGPKAAGWNIRIHFDSFSDKWDEWFSSADYDVKRVSPIYSFSTRKLKVIGVVVVQRQITLRNQGPGSAGSDTSNQEVLNVKVFGYPVVLRCESFRSCEHVHRLVAEQSMRYAQPGQLKDIAEASLNRYNSKKSQSQTSDIVHSKSSSEQLELPFTVRIISMTSALTADNLEGLDTELGIEGRKSVISKATAERQKEPHKWNAGLECVTGAVPIFSSVMDRANGFQAWEGSYFPRDPVRPLCNLVHPKLLVVVDWHWNATRAPAAGQGRGCLAYRDHESFLKYLSAFIPPAMPAASVGMSRSASVKDTEANGAPGAPTEPPPNPSARSPISSGNPTLADCLKSFTGSEELDEDSWHCDHCKKLSCGSVSSSLSRLPDLLIMHIKRFGMTARFREKIRTKVTFPLTSLNMKPFTTPLTAADKTAEGGDDSMYLYDLYAVANHLGGMSGGHYTAMVKCNTDALNLPTNRPAANSSSPDLLRSYSLDRSFGTPSLDRPENTWMCFDDDVVTAIPTQVLEDTVVSDAAYVLFYRRRHLTPSNIVNLSL